MRTKNARAINTRERILQVLASGPMSAPAVGRALGIDRHNGTLLLRRLRLEGLVTVSGTSRPTYSVKSAAVSTPETANSRTPINSVFALAST